MRVLHGARVIFSGTIAPSTQTVPFHLSVTVKKRDQLDFAALTGAGYAYPSTGLRATIQ